MRHHILSGILRVASAQTVQQTVWRLCANIMMRILGGRVERL